VMLTSLGRQESDTERLEKVQVSAFLTKPIKPSQLYNELMAIFDEQPNRALERKGSQESQFDPTMGRLYPLRLLLAEDNPTNQRLAVLILGRLGYTADVVGNGREALEALEDNIYDLILMDIQMPEMDGLEATAEIRRRWPEAHRPRIVAMTADVLQEEIESCQKAGMDGYVAKPIRVPELVAALKANWMRRDADNALALEEIRPAAPADEKDIDGAAGELLTDGDALLPDAEASVFLDPVALNRLLQVVGDSREVLAELIDSFLEDAPELLQTMTAAAQTGDAKSLRRAAHTLKSNSADFGALELCDLCKELEARAKNEDLANAELLVEDIIEQYNRVVIALKAVRGD